MLKLLKQFFFYSLISTMFLLMGCKSNTANIESEFTGREVYWKLFAKNRSDNKGSVQVQEKKTSLILKFEVEIEGFSSQDNFTATLYKGQYLAEDTEKILELGNVIFVGDELGRSTTEFTKKLDGSELKFVDLLSLDAHVRVVNNRNKLVVSGGNVGANEGIQE